MNSDLLLHRGLSLDRLQSFITVARAGGISRAAPGDATRQSQLSRQIAELEQYFSTKLAERRRGQFVLSAFGRDLLTVAQSHFHALSELKRQAEGGRKSLAIGAGDAVLHELVVPACRKWAEAESLSLSLQNLQGVEIVDQLRKGGLDAGFVRAGRVMASLATQPVGSVSFRLILPASPTRRFRDPWGLFDILPVALMADNSTEAIATEQCGQRGIQMDLAVRATSLAQVLAAVEQLGCLGIVPHHCLVRAKGRSIRVVEVPALAALDYELAGVWNPRTARLRPWVDAVVRRLCCEVAKGLGSS